MVRMLSYPRLFGSPVIRSMAIWANGGALLGTEILYRGTLVWCMRFLFCRQIAHPLTYCLIQAHPPGQQKRSRTFLAVLSHPGCAASPLWYACMMRRRALSSGGTITFWFSSNHRPPSFVHHWHSLQALNHGWYCRCAVASTPSNDVGSPALARLRNTPSGRSNSCRS